MLHPLRDLIKDTPLKDRTRRRKDQHPVGNKTHDLKSFALQACALPLGYNRSPSNIFVRTLLRIILLRSISCMAGSIMIPV